MNSYHVEKPKRIDHFDVAKGILILLVVYGHTIQFFGYFGKDGYWSDPVFKVIYMFHMPLFAAYSGYFMPQRRLEFSDIVTRAKSLIYPMVVWSLVLALLFGLRNGDLLTIPSVALSSFSGAFWFLWAIFIASILLWLGQMQQRRSALVYVLIAGALILSPDIWPVLPMIAFVFPFFIGGYYLRRLQTSLDLRAQILTAFGAFLVAAACFTQWEEVTFIYNNRADLFSAPRHVMIMFMGATAATITAGCVLFWTAQWLDARPLGKALSKIGRSTLEIYILQTLFFAGSGALARKLTVLWELNAVLLWPLCAGIAVVLTVFLCAVSDLLKATSMTKKFFFGTR